MPFMPFAKVEVGYAERSVLRPGMRPHEVGDDIYRDGSWWRVTSATGARLPTPADSRSIGANVLYGDTVETIEYVPLVTVHPDTF